MDLWIDTERPDSLDKIKGQNKNVELFRHFLKTKQVPNLLLYGSKGTCKTSTILSFCKDLYGEDYKSHTIELNASHERGINDVRNKIKMLSKQRVKHDFKFIILDEADSMTKDAMFALRMIMEDYANITRFCLICNYPYKIIKPILSRCISIYFPPLSNDVLIECGKDLTNNIQDIEIENNNINSLSGDLRKYLLELQCYGKIDNTDNIIYQRLWDKILPSSLNEIINELEEENYNMHHLIEYWNSLAIKEGYLEIIPYLSLAHHRIINGCDPIIQSYHMISNIKKIIMKKIYD